MLRGFGAPGRGRFSQEVSVPALAEPEVRQEGEGDVGRDLHLHLHLEGQHSTLLVGPDFYLKKISQHVLKTKNDYYKHLDA